MLLLLRIFFFDVYYYFIKQVKPVTWCSLPVRDGRGGVDHFKSLSHEVMRFHSPLSVYMLLPLEK